MVISKGMVVLVSIITQLGSFSGCVKQKYIIFIQGLTAPWFVYIASPQRGDLSLSCPPSGQGAGGGAQTSDRRVPADLGADSLAIVSPTPPLYNYSPVHMLA
ncbi:hypothetical protein PoB_005955800 [Plakobranchus ocellatus]|uniref:Uncharacterized protein n=1 Tax=Plakobranchus ocellatus TaxID=259542 RepID=A0AAV4CLM9_9GAST|nr:hypothetical protein PoB_005955800 [Plakobranchus ocellatus]